MKPNHKNWVSNTAKNALMLGTMVLWTAMIFCGIAFSSRPVLRVILTVIIGVCFAICLYYTVLFVNAYDAFDYKGRRQIARKIIDAVAQDVVLADGATCLDVGCGTGALAIACAKKNPTATVVGIDTWHDGGADANHKLCKNNAEIEGVANVAFAQGNAIALEFDDGTFDCVVSNYCYHTIDKRYNRQDLLLESLRVLKKGGSFVIHDIMSPNQYGDMDQFCKKLLDKGYQRVELINTTNGMVLSHKEAKRLRLADSYMLVGIK